MSTTEGQKIRCVVCKESKPKKGSRYNWISSRHTKYFQRDGLICWDCQHTVKQTIVCANGHSIDKGTRCKKCDAAASRRYRARVKSRGLYA